jgi:hypothetical protein
VGIPVRLDREAFPHPRLQERAESILPYPCRIDRSTH